MKQIYRQAALEKLSSPERLDSLMQITNPKGWIALLGMLVVIAGAVVWGFLGSAPDNVAGAGILLHEGGIFNIEASGSGLIRDIVTPPGASVAVGDIIAHLDLPDLDQQIQQAQTELTELQANRQRAAQLIVQQRDLQLQSIDEDIGRLGQETTALGEQEQYLVKRLEAQRRAVELELITAEQAQATAQELSQTRASIVGNQAQLAQLQSNRAAAENSAAQSIFALDQQLEGTRRQLATLQLQHDQQSVTRSPFAGQVIDWILDVGNIAVRGSPLVSVELAGRDLQALIFVPLQGSRIRSGMTVHLSPEGVSWEEYGYMLGVVASVSDAPVSPEVMNRLLHNTTLVEAFSAAGGAYLVTVTPELDPSTPSGFKWTSRHGPEIKIGTGTLFTAIVTVDEQPPIALVIPALRSWLGF
jgi:HlyD family secretion protein